jgi:hypothetical protein
MSTTDHRGNKETLSLAEGGSSEVGCEVNGIGSAATARLLSFLEAGRFPGVIAQNRRYGHSDPLPDLLNTSLA